jgi:hypothetical protein
MSPAVLEKQQVGVKLKDSGFDIAQYIQDNDVRFYSMISTSPFIQYNYCMTAITAKLHTEGILITGDSLELKANDAKIIQAIDDDFVKVRRITNHAVIGLSGANLKTSKFETYAEEIFDKVKKLPKKAPKTIKNIADKVAEYLAEKVPADNKSSYILEAFVAGYSYDKDNKPGGDPCIYLIGNNFKAVLDANNYSAVPTKVRETVKLIAERVVGYDIDVISPLEQTIDEMDKTMTKISCFEKQGLLEEGHIGGKIRRWNITKDGIDPSFGDKLPVYAKKGKHI